MAADLRKWSDIWAVKLKKSPENFFKKVEGLDIMATSNEDLAKTLDVPLDRIVYLKRGYAKFGKPRRKKVIDFSTGVPIKVVERMYNERQKLLQRQVKLEEEKLQIDKELEKYKPLASAFEALIGAAKKVVDVEKKEAAAGR